MTEKIIKEIKGRKSIEKVGNLVMTDPNYDKDVWCRYERNLTRMKDVEWECEYHIVEKDCHETPQDNEFNMEFDFSATDFKMIIRPKMCEKLVFMNSENQMVRVSSAKVKQFNVGCDSASFVFGFTNRPLDTISTMSDGFIADVFEIKLEKTLVGIMIDGSLDANVVSAEQMEKEILWGLGLK